MCNMVLYVCPIFYGAFLLAYYHQLVCHWDTPYAKWLFLEVSLFISWILASVAFLLFAYLFKYRSLW